MILVRTHPVKYKRGRRDRHPWHVCISYRTIRGFIRSPPPWLPVESYEYILSSKYYSPTGYPRQTTHIARPADRETAHRQTDQAGCVYLPRRIRGFVPWAGSVARRSPALRRSHCMLNAARSTNHGASGTAGAVLYTRTGIGTTTIVLPTVADV